MKVKRIVVAVVIGLSLLAGVVVPQIAGATPPRGEFVYYLPHVCRHAGIRP